MTVSPQGDVVSERVISGPSALQQATADAFTKAKYIPFLRNLEPSVAIVRVIVVYENDQATISTKSEHAEERDYRNVLRKYVGSHKEAHGVKVGNFEILSDTLGFDFAPYLQQAVLPRVLENWHRLIPGSSQMKTGRLALEFTIMKDGAVRGLLVAQGSGDVTLDRPAFGSITASDPFPPLPAEFRGEFLSIRVRFAYNPAKEELAPVKATTTAPASN